VYRDRILWRKIRNRILTDGVPIRQVVHATGISRTTVRKMLANHFPKPYGPRAPRDPQRPHTTAIRESHSISVAPKRSKRDQAKETAFEWMRAVLQREIDISALRHDVGDLCQLDELTRQLYEGRLSDRNRSMVILASRHGVRKSLVCRFLGIDRKTVRKYLNKFEHAGASGAVRASNKIQSKV
jgi:hypothetical protein